MTASGTPNVESLRYGWRNLWRNRARTLITFTAVTASTTILIASYALMDGLLVHAVANATSLVGGEVQVHAPGYLTDRSLYDSIENPAAILQAARAHDIGAASRRYGYGLAAAGRKSVGVLFWGIDPPAERSAFDLPAHVASGRFLPDRPARQVVLGRTLARSLGVRVGDELVVVVQAADGSLGNDLFTVAGILQGAGERIDRSAALIHAADFAELFVSGDRGHEVALNSRGRLPLDAVRAIAAGATPRDDVRTWRQLLPALNEMITLFDAFIWVFGLVFLLAAGVGVMNTMLMAAHERVQEFGLIKALGGTPGKIIRDLTVESLVLTLVATLVGIGLGVAWALYLAQYGIDTTRFAGSFSIGGVAFDPIWRAALSLKVVAIPAVLMVVAGVVPSIYPAVVAARLDPVKALTRA